MDATWVSLLPPLIVIIIMCITQRLNSSLAIGIAAAALITTNHNIYNAAKLCAQKCIEHISDSDNIYLYLLLIMISSLITLLTVTGSAAGCAQIIGKKMKSKRSVEGSSIALAFLLAIDDYLSILTVGFVMCPIADRLAVARTKLAYIMHALAGPLVIIVPISTWAAAVLVQLDNAGINMSSSAKIIAEPFYVYLKTIPFIFYSLIAVVSVCFVVYKRISFGLIGKEERDIIAIKSEPLVATSKFKHSIVELLLPIGLLVGGVFVGILYSGGFYLLGGNSSFVQAFRDNNETFFIFFISGSVSFCVSALLSMYKRMIVVQQLPAIIWEGFILMRSSIIMIMLASILGSFLRVELQAGNYVAALLLGKAPLFLIPVMVFVVSLAITLATGSAWGTFSLLIPIVTQMLISLLQLKTPLELSQINLLFPTLGALLSGAACGNHIAPFAETTIMTATSTGIEPLVHAKSQLSYAVPVLVGSLVSFVIVGLMSSSGLATSFFISFGAGLGVCVGILSVKNMLK